MPYKISGTLMESARVIVIDEATWAMEYNENKIAGDYEIPYMLSGFKTVIGQKSNGKGIQYGRVQAIGFFNYLDVGSGKTYSDVQSAINASTYGDTIRIYPGNYGNVTLDMTGKFCHLIGVGSSGSMVFSSSSTHAFTLNNCTFNNTMLIENLNMGVNTTSSDTIAIVVGTVGANAQVVFNRCITTCTNSSKYGIHTSGNSGVIKFLNCYLDKTTATAITINGVVEIRKCIAENGFNALSGTPTILDVNNVLSNGYGPTYGNFYGLES